MKKGKKSAKEILSIAAYMLIGGVVGVAVMVLYHRIRPAGGTLPELLLVLGMVLLAYILQIPIHEAGHLVFGLLTGYRFVSYRVFNLMWIRQDEKVRFRRMNLAGTAGQCLLGPPEWREDLPYVLYNLGGVLFNLLFAALCWALSGLCPPFAAWVLRMSALCGLYVALANGIPLRMGGIDNDGKNIRSIRRDASAKRAFWLQMTINEHTAAGVRLQDMPEEWFSLPDDEYADNPLVAFVAVERAARLVEQRRFGEAAVLQDRLRANPRLPDLFHALLENDRIFCELMSGQRRDILDGLQDKKQTAFWKAMKQNPAVLRTRYALALLDHRDKAEADGYRAAFDKAARSYPSPVETESERELMALAEEKVNESDRKSVV